MPSDQSIYRIAHVSDLHLADGGADRELIERLISSWEDCGVDHAVVTGDVTHDGDGRVLGRFDRALRKRGWGSARCTVLGGNHDLEAKRAFRRRFGWEMVSSRRLAENRIALVTVDSVKTGTLIDQRLWSPRGWVSGEALEALDEALRDASDCQLRVVAIHHHLFQTPASDRDWLMTLGTLLPGRMKLWGPLENADELLERARAHGVGVILCGHSHTPRARRIGPIRCYIGGSTSAFEEYRVFDVDAEGRFEVRWAQI